MDPYLHASAVRGEGFQIDDVGNLDEFARHNHALRRRSLTSWRDRLAVVVTVLRLRRKPTSVAAKFSHPAPGTGDEEEMARGG